MVRRTIGLLGMCAVAVLPLAHAQSDEEAARERLQEARELERVMRREMVDVEVEMRDAESRLAEAARRVAELSSRRLQNVPTSVWSTSFSSGPVLGISIGPATVDEGPVEGVEVLAVSPGGAAAEAGLRARDVITAVNGESLSAATSGEANQALLDFMAGVEEGDVIDVEYLRAGKSATLEVAPRQISPQVFSFGGGGPMRVQPPNVVAPMDSSIFILDDGGWGDMEMVKLTEDLGRYFGTSDGMLVVRAPREDGYELKDGDVILDIDGRKPTSVRHAVRILGSYQHGETLKVRIMRDQRSRTLEIEVPEREGMFSGSNRALPVAPRIQRSIVIERADQEDDRI